MKLELSFNRRHIMKKNVKEELEAIDGACTVLGIILAISALMLLFLLFSGLD